jgi:hypothetical protein
MPPTAFTYFVFQDFENVREINLALIEGKAVHVTLLIGKKQTWLDLSLVRQIHRFAAQVELVEVGASGHNALDIILGCHLGQAIERNPGAEFFIVSGDKDFEPMIAHLQSRGIKVTRHESLAGLPFLVSRKTPPPKSASSAKPKPRVDRLEKLIAHLRNSPPSNRTKLEHMIMAFFKPSLPAGGMKGVIAELVKRNAIVIDATGKVTRPA